MSEFRQDLVSGDWIIFAPKRGARPHDLFSKKAKRKIPSRSVCPFENLEKSGNWPPVFIHPGKKNWRVAIVPNKYPALVHHPLCVASVKQGPYLTSEGVGHHDLVVTRDHYRNFQRLTLGEATELLEVFQGYYKKLSNDKCLLYTSLFFNWGATAGATIYHPHYQLLTLPVIPPDIAHSLRGSEQYFRKHRTCAHCVMIRWEERSRKRLIAKNKGAIAFAPFTPRTPFEVRVFPKRHIPSFEETPRRDLRDVAAMLQLALRRIERNLNDPDLNFFIHTAPLKNKRRYRYYHWHIEITPKVQIPGGFELSTGMEINIMDPDRVAASLRGKR